MRMKPMLGDETEAGFPGVSFAADRNLENYVDSNWATKFSCSGGMFFFYGCLFHWFSKMQRSVTLSSAEAEFFGAMLAAKEVIFIRELLIDLGFSINGASASSTATASPPSTWPSTPAPSRRPSRSCVPPSSFAISSAVVSSPSNTSPASS